MHTSPVILQMQGIDKRYPGVHALDHVDFDLRRGEVHVLLGENGAGKSTLMKILSGSVPRDGGQIIINGEQIGSLNPEKSRQLGIGMVYQELSLVPSLSAAENILLGRLPRNRLGLIDWKETRQRSQNSLSELGVDFDPQVTVRELDVAEQQLAEIARVLATEPQILLLDEPTSALSDEERDRLFAIIRRLRDRGESIVYISHRLEEVGRVGDRVTVLRDGVKIGTLAVEEADEDRLVQMLVGRELTEHFPKHRAEIGDPILKVDGLSTKGGLQDVSFELRHGEILGVFGLMGAGQVELARALFGLREASSGELFLNGEPILIQKPGDAIRLGIGYLTRDRREGLVPMLPIPPNVTLAGISQMSLFGRLQLRTEKEIGERYVRELRIQTPSLDRQVIYLSGGNQQKVVLARWLASNSKVLIFDEPTRGIDVGAKAEVFGLITGLIKEGVGILMISSEMPEILAMSDRVLVIQGGKITAEFGAGEATQENLLRAAS